MLKKLLSWIVSGLLLIASPVDARPSHGGLAAGTCLKTVANGCPDSPGGNFQVANFYTGYTGTVYPSRPDINMPGVDYKSGMPLVTNLAANDPVIGGAVCGMNTMQDPKTATTGGNDDPGCGVLPAHCSYSESVISTQLTVPEITCAGTSNNIVLRGFNLAPVGGHGGTYLFFNSLTAAAGNKTVAFNNLEADAGLYSQSSFGTVTSQSSGDILFYANNLYGHWLDTYSAQGNGTGSISSTTVTITACSACNFKVGQIISTLSVTTNNAIIIAQLTGTGSASCPDPTCNGGIGTYQINQTATRASQNIISLFFMGGGMNLNTTGNIRFLYNAITQVNGRVCTASQRVAGGSGTVVGTVEDSYNYIENGVYANTVPGAHYEICEWVLQDGQLPMTWTNVISNGNVIYQDANIAASTTTSPVFVSTGAVASLAANYTLSYTNVTLNNNTSVMKGGAQSASALANTDSRGSYVTNWTSTNNWIDKGVATYYELCGGAPSIGGVNQVSFFAASDDGAHNFTVSAFQGGVPIAIGMHIFETKGYITAQQSGTTGGAGVYTTTDTVVSGSSNKRAAPDTIINPAVISGNVELTTGALISQANFLSLATGANFCVYNGF